jgi:hypothetical protein
MPAQAQMTSRVIRLPLLTGHPAICAQKAGFCAHFAPNFLIDQRREKWQINILRERASHRLRTGEKLALSLARVDHGDLGQ